MDLDHGMHNSRMNEQLARGTDEHEEFYSFMVEVRGWDGSGLEYLMDTKEGLLLFKVNAPGISFIGTGLPCNI